MTMLEIKSTRPIFIKNTLVKKTSQKKQHSKVLISSSGLKIVRKFKWKE